ncbi:DUF2884 family protein [Luteimonas aestuarii]|uniref:DUF2884 family protein n=1 Tax=Luteimonas aestuarii TaxID=453837 RepID=A0A4R5TKY8_9GAMM|nr:DUF2884 family protein [Luteimonas aestuarii]TDK23196.1 DUF2884 family protein [Luteimonas aestuarii]
MAGRAWVAGIALAFMSSAATAQVGKTNLGRGVTIDADCQVSSDYSFHLTERSVVFTRKDGTPARVLMRDGGLFIDDAWVQVSADDRRRIREYERGARAVMPLAQRIGREAAQIALAAIGEVAAAFSNDPAATRRKLDEARTTIDDRLQQAITPERFHGDALGAAIGNAIGDVVPTLVGDVVSGALRAAFSGDASRFQRIEQDLDGRIEAIVEPRAKALERDAEALCQRMEALDALDDALEYRLPDGRALSLLTVERKPRRTRD